MAPSLSPGKLKLAPLNRIVAGKSTGAAGGIAE
jgi:hypothetical protein